MGYRIIKKMEYQKTRKIELLYDALYRNYHFYILNLGTHPTAYIEIPKDNKLYGIEYNDIDINVHGGLTYSRDYIFTDKDTQLNDNWYIGWDYAHLDDYIGGMDDTETILNLLGLYGDNDKNNKKWTTEEIIEHCKDAINQLCEI